MKVSREQAAGNRERIVEAAARLFRERGFEGVSVAEVMEAAGLTHGGFYGHFRSKDDLAAQACGRALGRSAERWSALAAMPRGQGYDKVVERYLAERHRDMPGHGCVLTALGPDVARQDRSIRRACTQGMLSLLEALTKMVPGRTTASRRRKALAAMAQMVGAVVLARMVDDPDLSKELLEASAADLGREKRQQMHEEH